MAENRVIGAGNRIPWQLPGDFAWFKRMTMGGVLVMGRKTFESIGRPLPGRETVVLTRHAFVYPGVSTAHNVGELEDIVVRLGKPVWVAGGGRNLPRIVAVLQ